MRSWNIFVAIDWVLDLPTIVFVCCFGFKSSRALICFSPLSSIVFICFSNGFPDAEWVNLACSIICCWLDGNIFLLVRYSYLSILPDDKADISAAFLLLSCCGFSCLI